MTIRDRSLPRHGRQAVVLVHGIGQQRPLSTLSSYVDHLTGDHDLAFAAPDRISGQPDLKRMKVTWLPEIEPRNDDSTPLVPVTTDFYELYWANLVQGNEMRHVTAWLWTLLPKWRQLGPRLRRLLRYHIGYAGLALVAAISMIGVGLFAEGLSDSVQAVLRWIGAVASTAATSWIVWHIGDIPRYLNNVADNVTIQRSVRREGVELLERLHDKTYTGSDRPMYDRVIVIGHSLGSVVAYDIVRDYWTRTNRFYGLDGGSPPDLSKTADELEEEGERLWSDGPFRPSVGDPGFSDFQALQRRLSSGWNELRSDPPGNEPRKRWAITDLVTLACPLTHADFLLASGGASIERMQWNRTLASCPPRRQLDRATYRFTYVKGPRMGVKSWHSAAPFACVRWTNVYYASDVVGGPLQPLFGPGIVDVELEPPTGHVRHMPHVHSLYSKTPETARILQRVIWDGGRRADPSILEQSQRITLIQVLGELLDSVRPAYEAVSAAPLLRPLDDLERRRVADILDEARETSDGDVTIEQAVGGLTVDVLQKMRPASWLLITNDPEEAEEDPFSRRWEGEDEEEFEEEEEEMEEEEEE